MSALIAHRTETICQRPPFKLRMPYPPTSKVCEDTSQRSPLKKKTSLRKGKPPLTCKALRINPKLTFTLSKRKRPSKRGLRTLQSTDYNWWQLGCLNHSLNNHCSKEPPFGFPFKWSSWLECKAQPFCARLAGSLTTRSHPPKRTWRGAPRAAQRLRSRTSSPSPKPRLKGKIPATFSGFGRNLVLSNFVFVLTFVFVLLVLIRLLLGLTFGFLYGFGKLFLLDLAFQAVLRSPADRSFASGLNRSPH